MQSILVIILFNLFVLGGCGQETCEVSFTNFQLLRSGKEVPTTKFEGNIKEFKKVYGEPNNYIDYFEAPLGDYESFAYNGIEIRRSIMGKTLEFYISSKESEYNININNFLFGIGHDITPIIKQYENCVTKLEGNDFQISLRFVVQINGEKILTDGFLILLFEENSILKKISLY